MNKVKKTMILLILLTYSTITVLAQTGQPPEIYYGGEQTSGAGAYTFTYNLISKSNNITKWQLESSFFTRTDIQVHIIAQDELEDSQPFEPSYILNPSLGTIEFNHESNHKFRKGTIRKYEITVYTNTYIAIPIDEIEYQMQWPPGTPLTGAIDGPINPGDIIAPPWYNEIPPITIPIGFILLLILAWRLKWF